MKNTHHEGHEEHEGKKINRKQRQVLINKKSETSCPSYYYALEFSQLAQILHRCQIAE